MKHGEKIIRYEMATEILRRIDEAIGDEQPTDQALRILATVKAFRSDLPFVPHSEPVDYLERVQVAVQRAWATVHKDPKLTGIEHDAIAGVDTPIGRLKAITYRRLWKTGRVAWATEYYLNDQPITIAEIRLSGLARRPTTRRRQKRKRK